MKLLLLTYFNQLVYKYHMDYCGSLKLESLLLEKVTLNRAKGRHT